MCFCAFVLVPASVRSVGWREIRFSKGISYYCHSIPLSFPFRVYVCSSSVVKFSVPFLLCVVIPYHWGAFIVLQSVFAVNVTAFCLKMWELSRSVWWRISRCACSITLLTFFMHEGLFSYWFFFWLFFFGEVTSHGWIRKWLISLDINYRLFSHEVFVESSVSGWMTLRCWESLG